MKDCPEYNLKVINNTGKIYTKGVLYKDLDTEVRSYLSLKKWDRNLRFENQNTIFTQVGLNIENQKTAIDIPMRMIENRGYFGLTKEGFLVDFRDTHLSAKPYRVYRNKTYRDIYCSDCCLYAIDIGGRLSMAIYYLQEYDDEYELDRSQFKSVEEMVWYPFEYYEYYTGEFQEPFDIICFDHDYEFDFLHSAMVYTEDYKRLEISFQPDGYNGDYTKRMQTDTPWRDDVKDPNGLWVKRSYSFDHIDPLYADLEHGNMYHSIQERYDPVRHRIVYDCGFLSGDYIKTNGYRFKRFLKYGDYSIGVDMNNNVYSEGNMPDHINDLLGNKKTLYGFGYIYDEPWDYNFIKIDIDDNDNTAVINRLCSQDIKQTAFGFGPHYEHLLYSLAFDEETETGYSVYRNESYEWFLVKTDSEGHYSHEIDAFKNGEYIVESKNIADYLSEASSGRMLYSEDKKFLYMLLVERNRGNHRLARIRLSDFYEEILIDEFHDAYYIPYLPINTDDPQSVATEPLAYDNADIVMDPENAGDNPQRYVGDHMNTLVLRTEDCFNQEKEIDIITYFETSRVAGEISGEYIEEEVILSEYPAWYGSGEKMLCPISIWGKKREGGIETISRTNQKYTILETNIVNVYADNYLGEEYWECQDNRYIRPYLLGKTKDENLNKYDCEYFLPVVDYSTNKLGLLAVGQNPTYPYFNNSNIVYMNNCIRAFVSGDNSSFFFGSC